MIHYYFKFGTGNEGLINWIKNNEEMKTIPLSIYFWPEGVDGKESYLSKCSNKQSGQVSNFFNVKETSNENYFWIFYKDKVYCYKPISGIIYNGGDKYPFLIKHNKKDGKKYLPKSMDVKLNKEYKKHELPEIFANTNSNQHYNRGTIAKLGGKQEEIANNLINNKKILISKDNYLDYLSPIEFETLIFLIFNYDGSYCSSFRGGTLKDFDLKVSLLQKFPHLLNNNIDCTKIKWIQVKKKDYDKDKEEEINGEFKKLKEELENYNDRLLIYLGKNDVIQNRILGKEWLTNTINERKDIQGWLKNMTFKNYELFNFSW